MARIEIEAGRFVVEGIDVAGLGGRKVKGGVEGIKTRRKGQMRWKDNSFLTEQQVTGERYEMSVDLRQQRVQPL